MNSHPRAFDLPQMATTPLACPRKMQTQDITPWTPARLAAVLLRTLLPVRPSMPLNRRA